jgi:hypothetical protein
MSGRTARYGDGTPGEEIEGEVVEKMGYSLPVIGNEVAIS